MELTDSFDFHDPADENAEQSPSMPSNPHLSRSQTVPLDFYHDRDQSQANPFPQTQSPYHSWTLPGSSSIYPIPEPSGSAAGLPYPQAVESYRTAALGDHLPWPETLNEGAPIGLNDPIFNYFDSEEQEVVDGSSHYFSSPVPMAESAAGGAYYDAVRDTYGQFSDPQINPGEGSSNIAPVAQVQAPMDNRCPSASQTDIATLTMPGPRGKLQLIELGEGQCEYKTQRGNPCGRRAPLLSAIHGSGERFCMCLSKHLEPWRRSHALLPAFRAIPKTLEQARREIFPDHEPLERKYLDCDPSLVTEGGQEDKWQLRFLEAAMTPYEGDVQKLRDHQRIFNGNVEIDEDGQYADDMVNTRIALLYHIAWHTHVGGERVYAVNGDSGGYPKETWRLTFVQRLLAMEQLLKTNKRIVMDVIQGRGVTAFVENPEAFYKRKATNNMNNDSKRRRKSGADDDGSLLEGSEAGNTPTSLSGTDALVGYPAIGVSNNGKGKTKMMVTLQTAAAALPSTK